MISFKERLRLLFFDRVFLMGLDFLAKNLRRKQTSEMNLFYVSARA